jgi:hypothetical protein
MMSASMIAGAVLKGGPLSEPATKSISLAYWPADIRGSHRDAGS